MSWQATKAVFQLSKFVKDRDFSAFRILMAIAENANSDGVCGVAGDSYKCLSYNGIAHAARVHRNTVYNLMPALLASGELEIVAQDGNGRGSWTVYRVTIIDKLSQLLAESSQEEPESSQQTAESSQEEQESSQQTAESSQDKGVTIDLVTIIERLSQQVERLSQQMAESSQQKPESSQGIVTNVTSYGCDGLIEIQKIQEIQGEGEKPPTPPTAVLHPDCPKPETDAERAIALHPALWVWLEAKMAWPGYDGAAYLVERMGDSPNSEALITARKLWYLSNNKPGNAIGILDWYDELCKDPTWTPKKRFSTNGKTDKQAVPSAGMTEVAPGLY